MLEEATLTESVLFALVRRSSDVEARGVFDFDPMENGFGEPAERECHWPSCAVLDLHEATEALFRGANGYMAINRS